MPLPASGPEKMHFISPFFASLHEITLVLFSFCLQALGRKTLNIPAMRCPIGGLWSLAASRC